MDICRKTNNVGFKKGWTRTFMTHAYSFIVQKNYECVILACFLYFDNFLTNLAINSMLCDWKSLISSVRSRIWVLWDWKRLKLGSRLASTKKWLTLHLRIKKLSMNSLRYFNSVLDTINHYWVDPAKYFCPKTSSLSAIYDSLKLKVLKVVESKNGHHFY